MTSLQKKNMRYYDQMADAEFNFQQGSFLSEFHIFRIFLPPKHTFILRLWNT